MANTVRFPVKKKVVIDNPWRSLRQFTDARIGIGRSGVSIPTNELLQFQLAHARARDAVHTPLNIEALNEELISLQPQQPLLNTAQPISVQSEAADRTMYLQRPDLGRRLSEQSRQQLQSSTDVPVQPYDLAIVIADGLSASAITENAVAFIQTFLDECEQDSFEISLAPIVIVTQGRVAIGDDIGALLNANATLMLIGERPGLSSPDSLGLYLTYAPEPGLTDDRRNCISNVRKAGLSYREAARKTLYLLCEARRLQISGVAIKDRSDNTLIENTRSENSFLLERNQ